jgi:uncharacterized protein YggE
MASRTIHALLLAVLLVTAGCLGTTTAAQGDGPGANDTRTIDVSATGTASADPDLAVVNVAVEARADTADAAREQVASDVASMREALSEFGIPDDAVRTTSFHVGPEYNYRDGGRELVGYRAYHAFEIESGVEEAGDVIDVAVGNGASQVQGVSFTLTEETRSELREEALSAAISSARTDAETIASASGVSLGELHSASTTDVRHPRPVPYAAEASAGDGARTVVEPGPVEVTATVQVSYRIG